LFGVIEESSSYKVCLTGESWSRSGS